jgi:hypothetical protein
MAILDSRAGVLVWAILVAANGVLAAEPKASPKFDGTALPQPPLQHQAWTAPATTLPATFVICCYEISCRQSSRRRSQFGWLAGPD